MALSLWRTYLVARAAPRVDREKVFSLLKIYQDMDRQVRSFQAATGLACGPGCGHCCENPSVETAVLELLPLATDLWRRGLAEIYLQKLEPLKLFQPCVFYQAEIPAGAAGHCGCYDLRPTICRLFGFATRLDKDGTREVVTCAQMKTAVPAAYERVCQRLAAGLKAPELAPFSRRVMAVDFALSQERIPINHALRAAIERVGFARQMERE